MPEATISRISAGPAETNSMGSILIIDDEAAICESLQTLPAPKDPKVALRAVPEQLMAAVQYSGRWTHDSYEEHAIDLRRAVQTAGVQVTGPAQWARYDPPWKPWFLRRNEVLLPITAPDLG